MWDMALRNESHKFDFSDNSTNVVPVHNLICFFYGHISLLSCYFIPKYIDIAVEFYKKMQIASLSLPQTILYDGFISI